MNATKAEWWEKLKASIPARPPVTRRHRVVSRTSVIPPEGVVAAGQGTVNESAPKPRVAKPPPYYHPFRRGMRVRFTERARDQFKKDVFESEGVVVRIHDLRYVIPDDPKGTRCFALSVRLDGRQSASIHGNGAYFQSLHHKKRT